MNIKLSRMQAHGLAETLAKTIHAEIIHMHLRSVSDLCGGVYVDFPGRRKEFLEVRATLASITESSDRVYMIEMVDFYLNQLCREKGTHRKWQDYRASVQAHQQRRAA